MNISTRGRYGLRALTDMTIHNSEGPMVLRVIAERQNISESYLEQVFTILRKAGLVRSIRGSQGGYELARQAKDISVGEILQALEGPIIPVYCVDQSAAKTACENEKNCITRPFWEKLRDTISNFLDQTTLQDLADQAPLATNQLPMYYI